MCGGLTDISEVHTNSFEYTGDFFLFVAGSTDVPDMDLIVENTTTGEVYSLNYELTSYAHYYKLMKISLPDSWNNEIIAIKAIDRSSEDIGWISISSPFKLEKI